MDAQDSQKVAHRQSSNGFRIAVILYQMLYRGKDREFQLPSVLRNGLYSMKTTDQMSASRLHDELATEG
jgi:hypothetical protein